MMKLRILCLTLLILLEASTIELTSGYPSKQNYQSYTYVYEVSKEGKIDVKITFTANGEGSSWIVVPIYEKYNFTVTNGNLYDEKKDVVSIFYANYSFKYSGTPTVFQISFSYKYGALIVEPNGAFFSTHIQFYPLATGRVVVYLPHNFKVVASDPLWLKKIDAGDRQKIMYNPPVSARILISFKTNKTDFITVEGPGVEVITPERYREVAKNLTEMYEKVKSRLEGITHTKINKLKVHFFVPSKMKDLEELGYTPFKGDSLGDVNVNLITIRMKEGITEQVMLHEFVHHYLWAAGIQPKLLWVHEGFANYLSTEILYEQGVDVKDFIYEGLDQVPEYTRGDYSFLDDWRPGQERQDVALCYAASLYIIKYIGDEYGGLNFYGKFFEELTSEGAKIDTTQEFVEILSKASGSDMKPMFKAWKFDLTLNNTEPSISNPIEQWSRDLLKLIVLLIVVTLIITVIVLKARSKEEEYSMYFETELPPT